MLLILPITCGWSPAAQLRLPAVARAQPPLACASSSSREPAEAQAAFERWMEATCPLGAVPRNYSTAPGVGVQTMEGALAATWHAVCLSLCQPGDVPSLSVVLLPLVKAVASQAGMVALQRHLRSCRDCCAGFGKRLELQTLHPSSDALGRASPVPALTLSRLGLGVLGLGPGLGLGLGSANPTPHPDQAWARRWGWGATARRWRGRRRRSSRRRSRRRLLDRAPSPSPSP